MGLRLFQTFSLKAKITIFSLAIFLAGIWSLTFYISQILRVDMGRLLGEQQFAAAALMADDIEENLRDRLTALGMVAGQITPAMLTDGAGLQQFLDRQTTLSTLFNAGAFVIRTDGVVIADLPRSMGRTGVSYADRDFMAGIVRDNRPDVIGPPVVGKTLHAPVIPIALPIRDAHGKVAGVLVGVAHLGLPNFLDPVVNHRHGDTGGYVLVDRQSRRVITASDKTRIMEALPAPGVNPGIDRDIEGFEGSSIHPNMLGVEHLASTKQIALANWYVSAQLPVAEAFAPIIDMQQRMLLASAILTLLTGVLTWRMIRRQLVPVDRALQALERQSDAGATWQPLPVDGQDEISALITGFNRLLATLKQREEILKESQEHLRCLTEMSSDFYWETDAEHRISQRTESEREAFEAVFKQAHSVGLRRWEIPYLSPDEAGWQKHRELLDAHLPFRNFEIVRPRANGSVHYVSVSGDPVFDADGNFKGYRGVGSDITNRKLAEKKIEQLAFYDQLTDLPNRTLLLDRLTQAMAASARSGHHGALLFLDLDNFKTLNDTFGHDVGDMMLKQTAQRLSACIRAEDTVARLGGDEFVVLMTNLSQNKGEAAIQTELIGEKIRAILGQTYQLGQVAHHTTSSIGAALFLGQLVPIEELLKQADMAMYESKSRGRNVLRFFDPAMESVVIARSALERDLREAITQNQFMLYYQAQMDDQGRLAGAEALVRWRHPHRGLVPPGEFIPLLEETGLILPVGYWILETACAQLVKWAKTPELAGLSLAVNVSARQMHHDDFVDQVLLMLERTGVNPGHLKLELTESLMVHNVEEVIGKMRVIQTRGVKFSLDDFGTGYSSLTYLKRLPLDQLKIDQSFVRDVLSDPDDAAIAKTIIALADSLNLNVIAEGVETKAQRDFLAISGCHAFQGNFFSPALPLEEFETVARGLARASAHSPHS